MALTFTIDHETPPVEDAYSGGTSEFGSSTYRTNPTAPLQGTYDAKATIVAGGTAYGEASLPANDGSPAATTPLAVGVRLKVDAAADWVNGDRVTLCQFYNGGTVKGYVELVNSAGSTFLRVNVVDAFSGTHTYTDTLDLGTDEHYVQVVAWWGLPMLIALYIDGAMRGLAASGIAVPTPGPDRVRIGCISSGGAPTITYRVDHVKGGSALGDVAEDVSPPDAPTALTATAVVTGPTFAAVDLAWTDNADDEDGFVLERAPDVAGVAGDWAEIDTAAADAVSYSDTGVDPGRYWYRVAATNVGGDSDYATTTASVMVGGEYRVYGPALSAANINYTTPIAYVPAGTATVEVAGLALAEDTDWWIAVRAVSACGVEEETGSLACVHISGGVLIGPPPNRIASATVRPAAAGTLQLDAFYSDVGAAAVATSVRVVRIDGRGNMDWDLAPIDTIAIAGTARIRQALTPTYRHGETVRLAMRAYTALGRGGPIYRLGPVAAAAQGPPAVDYVSLTQVAES